MPHVSSLLQDNAFLRTRQQQQQQQQQQRQTSVQGVRPKYILMQYLHRVIPHSVRRLFQGKRAEGEGFEESYRLRRMESHASMSAAKRRRIYVNLAPEAIDADVNTASLPHYPTNRITTSKYTPLTFVPKNLFEQFRRIANLYFLFVAGLSIVPILGGFPPFLSFMPLIFIITVTAIKDGIEDWKRRKSDRTLNNSPIVMLKNWKNTNIASAGSTPFGRFMSKLAGLFGHSGQQHEQDSSSSASTAARQQHRHLSPPIPGSPTGSSHSNHTSYFNSRPSEATVSINAAEQGYPSSDDLQRMQSNVSEATSKRPIRRKIPHSVLNHSESFYSHSRHHARWEQSTWQDVKVGDIVCLKNDDAIPADIVILSTSEPDGLCFIETKNLDGETNLKIRRGLTATASLQSPADVERAAFYVESESPHANLYSYQGALRWIISDGTDMPADDRVVHNKTESISINEILLRGCVLRNTEWVIGLVIFTGSDTKIMLNSGDTPSKRSRIERDLNYHIVMNFIILFSLAIGSAVANGVIYSNAENNSGAQFEFGADATSPFMSAFITFWSCLILYQNIVPISLYISIEIVKTAQAYFIHKDIDMYDERLNQPCVPKTWNISDDLGQVEYIFSDKTGTLTQNVMEFKKCTINGIDYGIGETDATRGQKMRGDGEFEPVEFEPNDEYLVNLEKERIKMKEIQDSLFENKYYSDKTTFIDSDLFLDMSDPSSKHAKAIMNFWTAVAVCHTVIPERDENDPCKIVYKAQSPDEAALVSTARDVGFVFLEKQAAMMHLEIMGQPRSYKILNILEFNSNRKRMSIILRPPEGGIVLVCKGADSVIYERLDKNDEQSKLREDTLVDLERFANEGLRTLCLAYRKISEEEYALWQKDYDEAANSIHNRDENIELVCEDIEHSLLLIGGTAIEDRLQEGVPECIALLIKAGIKLWVLTGDKTETAINIGFACNLLQRDMILIIIQAQDKEETKEQLLKALDKFWGEGAQKDPSLAGKSHALIIDGETLKYGLSAQLNGLLLDVGQRCKSVICCRVSPLQKAKVVSMVKRGLDVMTLSIGDGANDVSMIQEANVGVGIAGEEGRQAVMASDFAIAQFRFLAKLLLVHGRWSYIRVAEMILTFFYKNIVWTLTIFWFQFFCGFTALQLFDYTFIILYNLVFTSLPIMFMGAFDQDVDAETSIKFPALYLRGIKQKHFTTAKFWLYVLDGVYQSVICFFVPYFLYDDIFSNGGSANDLQAFGLVVSSGLVVVANLYVGLNMYHWTGMIFAVIFGSTIIFYLYCWVYANYFTIENTFYGLDEIVLSSGYFWLSTMLVTILTMLPHYVYKFGKDYFKPNDINIVREQMYKQKHPSRKERRARKMAALAAREGRSLNNDVASSIHQEDSGAHVLGDADPMDDCLDQVPTLRHSPTILSPEGDSRTPSSDIRHRQSSSALGGDGTTLLHQPSVASVSSYYSASGPNPTLSREGSWKVSPSLAPTSTPGPTISTAGLHPTSGYENISITAPTPTTPMVPSIMDSNPLKASTPVSGRSATFRPTSPPSSSGGPRIDTAVRAATGPTTPEPTTSPVRKFAAGYPTTSFSFHQEYATRSSENVASMNVPDRPRVKRQSTPQIPTGSAFQFMGNLEDHPLPSMAGGSPVVSPGSVSSGGGGGGGGDGQPGGRNSGMVPRTGFAFSADEDSAFRYTHLRRHQSASSGRADDYFTVRSRMSSNLYQPRDSMHGGPDLQRNSIDGSEFGPMADDDEDEGGHAAARTMTNNNTSMNANAAINTATSTSVAVMGGGNGSNRSSLRRPRGLSRSMTSPDVPVSEIGQMIQQSQQDVEAAMARLTSSQQRKNQRQSIQRVRFESADDPRRPGTSSPSSSSPSVPPSSSGIVGPQPRLPASQQQQQQQQHISLDSSSYVSSRAPSRPSSSTPQSSTSTSSSAPNLASASASAKVPHHESEPSA
ncbi:hypothetical protein DFQ27_005390 [Actinomortierella ambigua]|uniref:P-type phospholipid transporter n=1 Tax=Actinomortierella ambigua TaxID=1343610 RepID=A0A9P6U2M8_9FUNG|nr:hypothetical protein DFQ27_005390 [Actinomortierella ambigua]